MGDKLFKSHFVGLVNLIKILSKKKIKRFVHIGSSAEYGSAKAPQKENTVCNPKTPYGIAKFFCTNFLLKLNQINKFPVVILRLFLVYGPNQATNRILPQIIINSLKNKKFKTTKGDQYCDFCFVDDAVNAIFKTLVSKTSNGEIINIGSGKPTKIKQLINLVYKLIGRGKPQFGKLKYRKETNMNLYPNIKKAKRIIGWYPKTKLIQGLKFTIATYNK